MEHGYPFSSPIVPIEEPVPLTEEEIMEIKQLSNYGKNNKPAPDNNIFFEERSNPLSSKGN